MSYCKTLVEIPKLEIESADDGVWLKFTVLDGTRALRLNLGAYFAATIEHSADISPHPIVQWAQQFAEAHPHTRPVFSYGSGGSLLCDRFIEGVTGTLDDDSAKYYGGAFIIGESMSLAAARAIAAGLGGDFIEPNPAPFIEPYAPESDILNP